MSAANRSERADLGASATGNGVEAVPERLPARHCPPGPVGPSVAWMERARSPDREPDVPIPDAERPALEPVRPVLSNRAVGRSLAEGRRLPPEVGAEMGRALGVDVDGVRIHTGPDADRASRGLGARAFTVGHDIYFREGAYAPEVEAGRDTLAHELAHVAQGGEPSEPSVGDPLDPAEREARAVGRAVAANGTAPGRSIERRSDPGAMVHRQPEPGPGPPMQGGKPVFPPDIVADMSPRQRVEATLAEKDSISLLRRIDELMLKGDYKEATFEERIWLIRILGAVGPSWPIRPAPGTQAIADAPTMELMLWRSFGDDLLQVAADNLQLFKGSYARGIVAQAEPVRAIERAWESDIKSLARTYLAKNSSLVLGELEQVGGAESAIPKSGPISDVAPEREIHVAEVQAVAKKLLEAKKALDDLRHVPVGYAARQVGGEHTNIRFVQMFEPDIPPEVPYVGEVYGFAGDSDIGGVQSPGDMIAFYFPGKDPPLEAGTDPGSRFVMVGYEGVKQAHEMLQLEIADFTNRFPAIYAIAQADKLDTLAKASPDDARALVAATLHQVLENINKTYPKLEPGENLWLKMKPIHDQLIKGMVAAPSGTKWDDPLRQTVAEQIVKDFENAEFWKDLGLATLAMAAFVIAELATFGSATFFLATGVGLGIGAYQAYEKWDEYYTMARASGSAVDEEMQIVYPGQAKAAFLGAILDTIFAFLNVAGPAARWAKAARAGLVPGMVSAGAAAAEITGLEAMTRRVAAKEITRSEAKSLVERSVAELGVAETARRTGLQPSELLGYVEGESDVGKRIAAYAKSPEAAGPGGAAGMRPKGYQSVRGTRVVAPATDDWPEGLVHYGLTEKEARASYAKSIFEDPHREAGIWVDLDTGEHLVVQGSPGTVETMGAEGKGWMADPEFAGRRWHFAEHYHPTMGGGWEIARYPSIEDYDVLLHPYWGRTPPVEPPAGISSVIRWQEPRTGKTMYTSFGYDPAAEQPFWVEFKDAKSGAIRRERIGATPKGGPDYRPWLDREAKELKIEIDWSQHAESALERPPAGAAAVKVAPQAGEFGQALKTLATLEPAQADAVLSGAIEVLGPAEALRAAGMDWKTLSATLPKTSVAGNKLLAWRDGVLGAEIRGLMTEEQAIRTGTVGSFENDFDWNFLGAEAAENRAKVVSYLAGRTGMSPDQMRKLLAADFFTDPRRMFLYETLPAQMRDRVAARQAAVESQLIWNGRLTEARAAGDKVAEQQVMAQMRQLGVPEAAGGVKLLSPEDIRVAEADIDKLHGEFEKAMASKDVVTAEQRAIAIADRQAQVNAAGGGAYVSYGGVRKFAVEREAELAARLTGDMLEPGWYTSVLDQMPHMDHAVEELGQAMTRGDMAAAMRSIGKYGDRMTNMANLGLARGGVRAAEFEELEWQFKMLYARSKIAATDVASLQSILAKDCEGMLAKVNGLLTELQETSGTVLQTLQQQAKLAGIDVLFEEVQLLTHLQVRFLRLKAATVLQIQLILQALRAGKIPERWMEE